MYYNISMYLLRCTEILNIQLISPCIILVSMIMFKVSTHSPPVLVKNK